MRLKMLIKSSGNVITIKFLPLFFVINTFSIFIVFGQNINSKQDNSEPNAHKLVIDLELADTFYCENNLVFLNLTLSYKNVGNENIILYKQPFLPLQEEVFNVDNAENTTDKFLTGHYSLVALPKYYGIEDKPDKGLLNIIKPGQKYVVDNYLASQNTASVKYKGGLKEGKYALRFWFITFPFSGESDLLKSDWKSYGYLWANYSRSNFVIFEIKNSQIDKSGKCSDIQGSSRLLGQIY